MCRSSSPCSRSRITIPTSWRSTPPRSRSQPRTFRGTARFRRCASALKRTAIEFIVNPNYGQRDESGTPKAEMDLTCLRQRRPHQHDRSRRTRSTRRRCLNEGLAHASRGDRKDPSVAETDHCRARRRKDSIHRAVPRRRTPGTGLRRDHRADARAKGRHARQERHQHDEIHVDGARCEAIPEDIPSQRLDAYFEHRMDEYVHDLAIKEGKRVDGRALR